ncbi:hypothetical protein [Mycobacteroides abscessus]|uniref:Uncharacterized protein n=1 Tax=Mycobacteroides abscessus TaxID=36809 RepID=A0A0U0ZSK0_9MYCO|nr:hypothetical protein [Mycobacteroides abscessus]CPV66872.1 Uncharacterised protein [Mycobacteroides abscessus]
MTSDPTANPFVHILEEDESGQCIPVADRLDPGPHQSIDPLSVIPHSTGSRREDNASGSHRAYQLLANEGRRRNFAAMLEDGRRAIHYLAVTAIPVATGKPQTLGYIRCLGLRQQEHTFATARTAPAATVDSNVGYRLDRLGTDHHRILESKPITGDQAAELMLQLVSLHMANTLITDGGIEGFLAHFRKYPVYHTSRRERRRRAKR